MECVVAVDIGTQSVRAGLMLPTGDFVDVSSEGLELFSPRPGWAEQSPAAWWQATVNTVRDVVARNPEASVAAIGVGAQMHSLVPVDAAGEPLVDRVGIWSDKRAARIVEEFAARSDAAALSATAGNVPLPAWPGFKLAWYQREQPEIAGRAEWFLVAKDYITNRLTGAATTDPSEASGFFLMDASSDEWSPELAAALEVDARQLPTIAGADQVVGGVSPSAAADLGLAAGTPVVCGGGDMMCQLLTAGVTAPGRVAEVSGTASIMAAHAEAPDVDRRVMNLRGLTDGWLAFGMADAGGATFRWFVDTFCRDLAHDAQRRGTSVFETLTAEAADVPVGSDGLLFFPYLLGERTLGSPHSRGSMIGLTPSHGRAEMVRSLLEGITFELKRTLDLIDGGTSEEPLRITGGGAGSSLWNRIRAGVYGRPVCEVSSREGGLLGAGLLAACGAGWFPDAATAAEQTVAVEEPLEPHATEVEAYGRVFDRFCDIHDLLDDRWSSLAAQG